MRLDDSFCEREAEADAAASCREKGLENLVCQCFGYAGAAVGKRDSARTAFVANLDRDFPVSVHGLRSIAGQVHEDTPQKLYVSKHFHLLAGDFEFHVAELAAPFQ